MSSFELLAVLLLLAAMPVTGASVALAQTLSRTLP